MYYGNPYYIMAQQYGYKGGFQQNYYYSYYAINLYTNLKIDNYQNNMFIRKAEEENNNNRDYEGGRDQNRGNNIYIFTYLNLLNKDYHKKSYGGKYYKSRPYRGKMEHYYESKKPNYAIKEEREQRTRINSENFPPLSAPQNEKEDPRVQQNTELESESKSQTNTQAKMEQRVNVNETTSEDSKSPKKRSINIIVLF